MVDHPSRRARAPLWRLRRLSPPSGGRSGNVDLASYLPVRPLRLAAVDHGRQAEPLRNRGRCRQHGRWRSALLPRLGPRRAWSMSANEEIQASAAGAPARGSLPRPDGRRWRCAERWIASASWPSRRPGPSVWICAEPHGHIQAVGRDGGAQAVPLPRRLAAVRGGGKYDRMLAFGRALPRCASASRPTSAAAACRARRCWRRRAAAGDHPDPRRQRRIRPRQQELRPDHPAQAARDARWRGAGVRLQGQERQDAPASASTTGGWRDGAQVPGAAGPAPVPVRDETARGTPSDSADVNAYLREARARTSPPRTSAPGPPRWSAARALRASRRRREAEAKRVLGRSDPATGRATGQHAGHLPQVLCPSGGARRLCRGPSRRSPARPGRRRVRGGADRAARILPLEGEGWAPFRSNGRIG